MRVVIAVYLISLFEMFHTVFGISTKKETLLDEEFHRGAEDSESSKNHDQLKVDTFQTHYKSLDYNGYANGYPGTGYLVHEGVHATSGHDPTLLNSLHGYVGNIPHVYGNNAELTQAYGYSFNLPHNYGYGGDLPHQHEHSSILTHEHHPQLVNCFDHSNQHVDYKQYHEGGEFGVTGIGNYIKKKLTLKKIFLPLAGIALLAAAGVWSSANPVLLQLGTLSGASGRSRVKRSNELYVYSKNPFIKQKLKDKIQNEYE